MIGRGRADRSHVGRHPRVSPDGHPLGPGTVVVGWYARDCVEGRAGHRTYWCWTCGVTLYEPPHTP